MTLAVDLGRKAIKQMNIACLPSGDSYKFGELFLVWNFSLFGRSFFATVAMVNVK